MPARAAILTLLLLAAGARAADCREEQEPNGQPDQALDAAGCVSGAVGATDNQDLWRWRVDDWGSLYTINVEPGQPAVRVQVLKVDRDAVGRVSGSWVVTSLDTRPGALTLGPFLAEPGEYFIGVASATSDARYQLGIESLTLPGTGESEPNDRPADAMALSGEFEIRGDGDIDHFAWTLSETDAAQRWDIALISPVGGSYTLNLLRPSGRAAQSYLGAKGHSRLRDLALDAGTYRISLQSAAAGRDTPYVLSARPMGPRGAGFEEEPNDRGTPAPFDGQVVGHLDEGATANDHFALAPFVGGNDSPDARHDLVFESDSPANRRMCLLDAEYREIQCRQGSGRIALSGLHLNDPELIGRITGASDPHESYRLGIQATGEFPANAEREPNGTWRAAAPLPVANAVRGHFDGQDTDVYRLVISGPPEYWRIQAIGRGLDRLSLRNGKGDPTVVRQAQGAGRIRLSQTYLLPGTHYIEVKGADSSYLVRALPQGPPDPDIEREPNEDELTALPIRFGQTRRGVLPAAGDRDTYRFRLETARRVEILVTPPEGAQIGLALSGAANVPPGAAGEPVRFVGELLPGDHMVQLSSRSGSEDAYSLRLDRVAPDRGDLDATLTVNLTAEQVGAFSEWHQSLAGEVAIHNTGDQPLDLRLAAEVSTARGSADLDRARVSVAAGATTTVGLSVELPPDLWSSIPVEVLVTAIHGESIVSGNAQITASPEAPAVLPHFAFAAPDALLGAIDVAGTGLGASLIGEVPRSNQGDLHDQFAPFGHAEQFQLRLAQTKLPHALTVRLAPHRGQIIGLALDPGRAGIALGAQRQLAGFDFELSTDGATYQSVLSGELEPSQVEQYFVLDAPRPATHARLVLKSTHGSDQDLILGGWKVLADPAGLAAGVNLADPTVGGHIAYNDLESAGRFDYAGDTASPLLAGPRRWQLLCREDCRGSSFVVGFHRGRTAEITRVEWSDAPVRADPLPDVRVSVSTGSPVGPWRDAGTLAADPADASRVLEFAAPVAARYIRFVIPPTTPINADLPDVVRILERPVDGGYRSVLGEWGSGTAASAEWRDPPEPGAQSLIDDDSAEHPLPFADRVRGTVGVGVDEDHYDLSVPNGANTLELTVSGEPTVPLLELVDAQGERLPLLEDQAPVPGLRRWHANVVPGGRHRLRVYEPVRSVVFAWDTSGSVAPFRPMTYQALERFATGVHPGREVVNLMPFEHDFLLDAWESEPTVIWQAVQDFYRVSESSQTALTVLAAAEKLAERDGSRSIVVIGDLDQHWAESRALWRALAVVQPHIYLFQVARTAARSSQVDLANWAAVNHGDWRRTDTIADLEVAFERAAARIRRPVDYEIAAAFTQTEPPGPGRLRVVNELARREGRAEPTALGNTAVEFILDASGSMLQRLSGQRRIDIAKETLTTLVSEVLPPGTPVALRVFGHLEGNYSCRTDLVAPLAPLHGNRLAEAIADIEAQNLAATPIGASLQAVAQDLRGAPGSKLVVLLTDGEETCEGDPSAAIDLLRDRGLDVRINIVGFAIDDETLKATFAQWADSGGGAYFDAAGADELGQAVARALRIPFRVLDEAGNVVGNGSVNGEPIELSEGRYVVEAMAEPPIRREDVIVTGEQEVTVMLAP